MSKFKIRGFIEGFYGRVWSDEKRRRVLKLVAENGMNAYFYAPKDDPFLRQEWRSEYDSEALARFSSLFRFTKEIGMELYYCLSPGLDMVYSSPDDLNTLFKKFTSIYDIGVRKFGLFFDDIPGKLTHAADKEMYASVCDAHISLINRLSNIMPADTELVICPMQYHGLGTEEYITTLCRGIPENVKVFWTGKKICSPELTSDEAKRFIEHTGRKPLYWDNFPVNDAEMYGEMHIGPYLNRSADLNEYSEGIVSNVMEYPLCSAIPLLTICDYLNDPSAYEPEKSFVKAVEAVTGDSFQSWMPFLDHTRYSCLCDCFSVFFSEYLGDIGTEYFCGNTENAAEMFRKLIAIYEDCSEKIKSSELYTELKKWADRFEEITDILRKAEKYIVSAEESDRIILKEAMIKYNSSAYKLAAFDLRACVEHLVGEFTI